MMQTWKQRCEKNALNIFSILNPVIEMKKKLRIAFVSPGDPNDKRSWSGTAFSLMQALGKHVGETEWICLDPPSMMKHRKILSKLSFMASGKRGYPDRTLKVSQNYADQLSKKLAGNNYDLIFASAASVEMACVNTSIPIVYVSDATFSLVKDIYPIFSNLSDDALRSEEFFEQSMIMKSSLLAYPSHWAAQSALRNYEAEPAKVRVVPFGANLNSVPDVKGIAHRKIGEQVNLLFLAKEWERKGGPIAVETLKDLLAKDIKAKLTICGVIPPEKYDNPQIEVISYLDKNSQAGRDRLQEILDESHFLLVPSRAECYGMVFCEANAYGIPVLAADVGGIPSIVTNGENGYLLPLRARGQEYASTITDIANDKNRYACLVRSSKARYDNILNWDNWGKSMRSAINEVIGV
jgi:glycosyltransferase involved in cell wall biosynthesis